MFSTANPIMGAQLHNRWNIGDLPRLLQQYEQKDIASEYDANELLTMTDADLAYGKRLMQSIDAALANAKSKGVNRDTVAEIEEITGAIPVGESTRRLMTSNYSDVGKFHTVVALEAASNYGRVALLLLLVTALIKIIGWIVSGGHGFSSSGGSGDGSDYKEKAKEELEDAERGEFSIIDTLQVTTVKQAYAKALKNKKTIKDMTSFNTNVTYLDRVLSELKAEDYLNRLAECIGNKSPFIEMTEDLATNINSQSELLRRAIERLLTLGVTHGVYSAAGAAKAWETLPERYQTSGTLIPNEVHYTTYNRVMGVLSGAIKNIAVSFKAMRNIRDVAEAYDAPQTPAAAAQGRNTEIETLTKPYADACRAIVSDVIIPAASVISDKKSIQSASSTLFPMVFASRRAAAELRDWTTAISIDGEGGRDICLATMSNIFGLECVEQDLNRGQLGNDDTIKLLATIVNMGPSALSPKPNITDLAKCDQLLRELEIAKHNIEAWGKNIKGGFADPSIGADVSNMVVSTMTRQITAEFSNDNIGGALAKQLFLSNEDFYATIGSMFNVAKVVCRAGALLQSHVNRCSKNPFLRKTKK